MTFLDKYDKDFYLEDTFEIARKLVGSYLCTYFDNILTCGKIVELESYIGGIDKASHSYMGKRTARTEIQFGAGGHAYIFQIYGLYSQFCIVTRPENISDVILIRALEPVEGLDTMKARRKVTNTKDLTNGPGRLCQALGITKELYGESLCGNTIWISPRPDEIQDDAIVCASRIGIDYAEEFAFKPWRFYLKESPYVSKKDKTAQTLDLTDSQNFDASISQPKEEITKPVITETNVRTLSLVSWNVNGIRSVYKNGFTDWASQFRPDILALQEVRAKEKDVPDGVLKLQDYFVIWNSGDIDGYSGTAILTKEHPIKIEKGIGIEQFDREGRIIILEFREFIFINCYFPNGGRELQRLDYKMDFCGRFLERCLELQKNGKPLIFCGDVNTAHQPIDLANPKSNENKTGFLKQEREWITQVIESGFTDSFRYFYPTKQSQYTWWSNMTNSRQRNVGWRLDYFFVSSKHIVNLESAFILPDVKGSDHCPVGITYKVKDFGIAEQREIEQREIEQTEMQDEKPVQLSLF